MKKIVIVGAGPAGVSAGLELVRRSTDVDVTILEESFSIGGISKTVNTGTFRMDMGGHRFFSKIDRVNKFWTELMPLQGSKSFDDKVLNRKAHIYAGGPDPEQCDNVMLVRNRVSRIYYNKHFFDYPISIKLDTIKNMGILTTFMAGISYFESLIKKRPEDSLENFYINRFGKKLYSMFFEGYTEKLWGRHPREISADWGSQRVKGLSVTAVIKDVVNKILHIQGQKETSLIEEFWYPKYGPGQLWETAAKEYTSLGGKIIMGARVVKVYSEDNKITSCSYIKDGKIVNMQADVFMSSMPVKDLVLDMENVPYEVSEIAANLPYRDFVTVGLVCKRMALVNETRIKTFMNIIPDCWIYIQDKNIRMGRIQIFNNWSPYMLDNSDELIALGLEYFCSENSKFFKSDDNKKVDFAIKELIKMGIIKDKNDVFESHVECVKKAYPAYFDSYVHIDKVIKYLDKFTNLFCIGRNGQHRYNNMDHSMMTAFLSVDNILSGESDKSAIWNVNTESEYHETYESNRR